MLDHAADRVRAFAGAEDRSWSHLAIGAAVCLGAVAASALISSRFAPSPLNPKRGVEFAFLDKPSFTPPASVFAVVWPALFSLLTWSGLRVWNAEGGRDRTVAFSLWGLIQALNVAVVAWGPERRLRQFLTALATLVVTGVYAATARKVDGKAAAMVAPYAGWMGFANLLTEELWRKNRPVHRGTPTIH